MFKNLDDYIRNANAEADNENVFPFVSVDLVLQEIETGLFSINKSDRGVFVDRVLHRIFRGHPYFLMQNFKDKRDFIYKEIERYEKRHHLKIGTDDEFEEVYGIVYDREVTYFVSVVGLIEEIGEIAGDFNVDYNEKKYPIKEFLKLKPEIDDIISKNKKFEDYLHHDNKEKLLEVLHTLFDGKKGKDVAVILLALQELGIIYLGGNRSEIYRSMREEFGDIGSSSGINDYLKKEYIMRSEIDNAKRIIEN